MAHSLIYHYLPFRGANLFTAVMLPEENGKFPTIISRCPYVDDEEFTTEEESLQKQAKSFAVYLEHGYAVVYQHCRGRGKSTGDCIPYRTEQEDGLFLQDWVRQQPFYNGELFLFGGSYTSTVHYVTAPYAPDIKGAVLEVQDTERYNCDYRNGFFKIGLHGGWYVGMYKKKSIREKPYTEDSFRMLPLSDFSKTVFGESAEDFDAILAHPNRNDPFWDTHTGGSDTRDAVTHANIPILLTTGFYDIYTGGIFDMWNAIDPETRAKCALAVQPYNHSGIPDGEPIRFENGSLKEAYPDYPVLWMDAVRGKCEYPFPRGKITWYSLFEDKFCSGEVFDAENTLTFPLGKGERTYLYNPYNPATFKGGLSANFGSNEWQDEPNSRYDIISLFTPEFAEDTLVRGKIRAKLRVRSDREDTCFYLRLSLVKPEGYYGLRDDIQQISNFCPEYTPGEEVEMDFVFDEHTFRIGKGEKLRIDISSSAFPFYVPHTNHRGLFSQQTTALPAHNTVILDASSITLPVE